MRKAACSWHCTAAHPGEDLPWSRRDVCCLSPLTAGVEVLPGETGFRYSALEYTGLDPLPRSTKSHCELVLSLPKDTSESSALLALLPTRHPQHAAGPCLWCPVQAMMASRTHSWLMSSFPSSSFSHHICEVNTRHSKQHPSEPLAISAN